MENPAVKQKANTRKESSSGAYIFLLIVAGLYIGAFLLAPERATSALQFSVQMLKKLLPILAVVCCFMFINNLLVKPSWVKSHVGQDSGLKGQAIAVVGGILSMGPIYVWYEILKELKNKGMRTSLIASFLYARSVKPQLLPLMVHYFGWVYVLVLIFYLIIFSVLNGWLTERFLGRPVPKS
ncbi:MAG: permease [Deltaproteobacteria bacterium]|jgi:hypothetical protein|nr:permease [Deltaproteobacteria bacterium]